MENYSFKSVTFGGFAKDDVIGYIEKTAQETAAVQERLRQENDALQERLRTVEAQVAELTGEKERLQAKLEGERSARQTLEPFRTEAEELRARVDQLNAEAKTLRPDARAYAQFRERIGAIECEARKRADDLEASATAKMERAVAEFRTQYQTLMATFDATAAHVTGELRKVEVNLAQLPRAMDQAGAELKELSARLDKAGNTEQ